MIGFNDYFIPIFTTFGLIIICILLVLLAVLNKGNVIKGVSYMLEIAENIYQRDQYFNKINRRR